VVSGLGVPIYNNPDAEEAAARKALQLRVATDVGLRVPRTVMTSSPDTARRFASAAPDEGVVFKPFRAPIGSACATQRLGLHQLQHLELLDNAPVIFQDLVEPHVDIRVTVIQQKIFAVESRSQRLDWRTDAAISWTYHQLPESVQARILALMHQLRLTLGHLDFRIGKDGEYVFFEVNPAGQFLFLEVDDERIQVTSALADLLIGHDV
jgi:glutathione synthase/RimK-type ligase-like ATP-grasp enzyme